MYLSENEQEIVNLTSNIVRSFGISEAASRIWATLVLIGKPLSQNDLKKLTNYSLSVISTNLSFLEKIGLIRKTTKKGKRKMYEAKATLSDIFKFFLKNITVTRLISMVTFLENHIDELGLTTQKNAIKLLNECKKLKQVIFLLLELMRKTREYSYNEITNFIDIKDIALVD